MARTQQRKGGPPSRAPPAKGKARPVHEEDLGLSGSDDDGDVFKAKKDKISLNMSDDEEDDDSLDVEGVYDLSEDDEDEDDEDGEGDDDDEELDDDALIEDAIRQGGEMAEIAKQAKKLGQKLKLQQGEDDEEDEEDEEEPAGRGRRKGKGEDEEDAALWGANKKAYYGADEEASSDEELNEKEVRRLQRAQAAKLAAADFGLEEDEDEDEGEGDSEEDEDEDLDEEGQATMGALADGRKAGKQQQQQEGGKKGKKDGSKGKEGRGQQGAGVEVEAVARDLGALGDQDRMAALLADAPELLSLLQDLQDGLAEVRHRVGPLLSELRDGGLGTSEGLSYLEAKHLLLLSYCIHIVFYLLLKAEGRPVRDHPVITRLVELRAYLEKIRPIDKQLSYQIDKLLKAAAAANQQQPQQRKAAAAELDNEGAAGPGPGSAGAGLDGDALRYGPRPDALVPKAKSGVGLAAAGADADGDGPVGVYRPPRLNPTSMELDEKRAAGGEAAADPLSTQDRRRLKELKARANRSDTLRALAAELAGAPEEERLAPVAGGLDHSLAALRTKAKLEARQEVEEDMFIRVPLTKDEAKRLRRQRREGLTGAGLLEDFGDEVADLVDVARGPGGAGADGNGAGASGRGGSLSDLFARQKVSQRFGADHPSLKQRMHGGDEDLPRREPLHERRAKFDAAAARRGARGPGGSEDGEEGGAEEYDLGGAQRRGGKRRAGGEEDDFYQAAKVSADSRKKARAEAHRAPALAPPAPDPTADGARGITDEIQRNRGLTPHRRKDQKNPRKKNRMKFEKAMVRVKGAVQPVRQPEAVAYGGEATGIKTKVAKSRRL